MSNKQKMFPEQQCEGFPEETPKPATFSLGEEVNRQTTMNTTDIKKLQWEGKDYRRQVSESLYIQVRKSSKKYLFRRMINGKTITKTIGPSDKMSLKEAQQIVYELRYHKHTKKILFRDISKQYYQDTSFKRFQDVKTQLKILGDTFGHLDINAIERADLTQFLRDYRERSKSMSLKLLGRLRMLFGFALSEGVIDENVVSGISSNISQYTNNVRENYLSDAEIFELFQWTGKSAEVLQFLLLTGLRFNEHRGQAEGDIFTIHDTKSGGDHWVYLTDTAKVPELTPYTTTYNWLKQRATWNVHDLRRTFTTVANMQKCDPFIVELTIGHALPGVMKNYNKHDYREERIEVFKAVEGYVLAVIKAGEKAASIKQFNDNARPLLVK